MLPEQVKAAAKKWEKAEAKATKADEDYTKEKETVLANRCGHATGCNASVWNTASRWCAACRKARLAREAREAEEKAKKEEVRWLCPVLLFLCP